MSQAPSSPYRDKAWKVVELRDELRKRTLSTTGAKEQLIRRLEEHEGFSSPSSIHQTSSSPPSHSIKSESDDLESEAFGKYASFKWIDLQAECRRRGLKISGTKKELAERLFADDLQLEVHPQSSQENLLETPNSLKPLFHITSEQWVRQPGISPPSVKGLSPAAAIESPSSIRGSTSTTASPSTRKSVLSPLEKMQQANQNGPELEALKFALKQERENLVLWKSPGHTILYFFSWIAHHSREFTFWALERLIGLGVFLFILAGIVYLYQLESHREIIQPIENFIIWYGGWVFLGFLSSFGVGMGAHTFVLYLGPFIAGAVLRAQECRNLDFYTTSIYPYTIEPFKFECDKNAAQTEFGIWELALKVFWEAFAWGVGTAIGELPPYIFARAARLADEQVEDHDDLEKLDNECTQNGWDNLSFIQRGKVVCYRIMKHTGFVGIMLLASVPNPLFDLAGVFAGYMLIPISTFFGATLIGKAVNKVSIQTLFVVGMFYGGKNAIVIQFFHRLRDFLPSSVADWLIEIVEKERNRYQTGQHVLDEPSLMSSIFHLILVTVIVLCIVAIVQSLAQAQLKREQDQKLVAYKKKE